MSADLEFENLVKLYYGDLYRFGLSLTGSEADAADLTQETFYIWANKGHQLQKPASVKSWLFTTLHREFLKTCRRRNRFPSESIDERARLPNVPADCAERADSQTLLRILGEIDEDFRAPLVLYYMEDLSYKEIAAVLALPLGTVQSRIARAKIQLLRRLSETNLPLEQRNEYDRTPKKSCFSTADDRRLRSAISSGFGLRQKRSGAWPMVARANRMLRYDPGEASRNRTAPWVV
jgi:RNA polymerase sigma factor, sigma-70 family